MHRFCADWAPDERDFFANLGIKLPEDGIAAVIVPEDDTYRRICDFFANKRKDLWEWNYYEYSKEELLAAPYCLLGSCHCSGYPKPEDSYLSRTFDTRSMCPECHTGRIQKDSFRVGKLSKYGFWGYSAWEHSVRFVSDEVYEKVFAPYGIPRRPVKKGSATVEGVSQLEIPMTDEDLDLYSYKYEICPSCGTKRYLPGEYLRHPYFPLHKHPLPGIYMTKEVFGAGWQIDHQIMASADIVKKLLDLKEIRLVDLYPCTTAIEQYWGPNPESLPSCP